MNEEFNNKLIDYFDAWDLVEFLQISVEEVIEAFPEKVQECEDELEELMEMGVRNR